MPLPRSTKLLMFNNNHTTRRVRPVKTLLDHVLKNTNMTVDQFCTLVLSKKLGDRGNLSYIQPCLVIGGCKFYIYSFDRCIIKDIIEFVFNSSCQNKLGFSKSCLPDF